jgi:hypothetical protein
MTKNEKTSENVSAQVQVRVPTVDLRSMTISERQVWSESLLYTRSA